jgi:flagellar biogenesis protein FliO
MFLGLSVSLAPMAFGQETAPSFDAGGVSPKAFQAPPAETGRFAVGQQTPSSDNGAPHVRNSAGGVGARLSPEINAAATHHAPAGAVQEHPAAAVTPSAVKEPKPLPHGERPKLLAPATSTATDSGTNLSPGLDSLMTVLGSMGIVLGLFVVTMWCLKRGVPKSGRPLPVEVVEVLGRAPLAGKQQMHLIRFGNKLVLVAESPDGIKAISEITESQEVDRIAGYCQEKKPHSVTNAFRGILDRLDERNWQEEDETDDRPNRKFAGLGRRRDRRTEDEYV